MTSPKNETPETDALDYELIDEPQNARSLRYQELCFRLERRLRALRGEREGWVMVPREPTREWIMRYCELTKGEPMGTWNRVSGGEIITMTFYEMARDEIIAMLSACFQDERKE